MQHVQSGFFKLFHRINDTDCFLGIHDRKLYVLGICEAISLKDDKPIVLGEVADKILPSLLIIFEGLKRAYQSRAQDGEEEESDDEEGDDDCEGKFSPQFASKQKIYQNRYYSIEIFILIEALSSDEDEVDENNLSYLERVENFATKKATQAGFEMSAELKASFYQISLSI